MIENHYQGERYEAQDLDRLDYSSSLIASASSSESGPFVMPHARKVDEVEGRDLTFAGLMDQLGLAFQEELSSPAEQSRKLDSDGDGKKVSVSLCNVFVSSSCRNFDCYYLYMSRLLKSLSHFSLPCHGEYM